MLMLMSFINKISNLKLLHVLSKKNYEIFLTAWKTSRNRNTDSLEKPQTFTFLVIW
jgi:hypothetical protein